jgi:tetratricopeptide (TPR) repeat protein
LGEQAFAEQNWEEAARQIGRYLTINGDDTTRLIKYGQAQEKIRPSTSSSIQQAIAAYSAVLRLDGGNAEAAKRLITIYLGESPGEAELKARQFLEGNDDPTIRQYLSVALIQQRDFPQAQRTLASLIHDHPSHVPAYKSWGCWPLSTQRRSIGRPTTGLRRRSPPIRSLRWPISCVVLTCGEPGTAPMQWPTSSVRRIWTCRIGRCICV